MIFDKKNRFLLIGFFSLLAWNAAIFIAPVLVQTSWAFFQYLGTAIYFFMDPVCHQIPARSLFLDDLPMPVCSKYLFTCCGDLNRQP